MNSKGTQDRFFRIVLVDKTHGGVDRVNARTDTGDVAVGLDGHNESLTRGAVNGNKCNRRRIESVQWKGDHILDGRGIPDMETVRHSDANAGGDVD